MARLLAKLLLAAALLIGVSERASASFLVCSETVNANASTTIEAFPSTLTFDLTVTEAWCQWCALQDNHWCHSTCPSAYSVVLTESDATVEALLKGPIPWVTTNPPWYEPLPFALRDGASVTTSVEATLWSYADCAAWGRSLTPAALPDVSGRIVIASNYHVTWNLDGAPPYFADCSTQVTCLPPLGPTRTIGYFKTHPDATMACVDSAPIDLGFMTISRGDVTAALGLLGASPAFYANGQKRSKFDQAQVLLGRQLLVAICNGRVFGSDPSDSELLGKAVSTLNGSNCSAMSWLQGQLDAFNNSGDTGENLFGSAAPATYSDPTVMTPRVCM
jgi:hypothetical protein